MEGGTGQSHVTCHKEERGGWRGERDSLTSRATKKSGAGGGGNGTVSRHEASLNRLDIVILLLLLDYL